MTTRSPMEICPLVIGYRPFRQIAERLAAAGIAVLRVDDRMVGGSGGDATEATTYDFAADVRDEIAWLRARPEIDPERIALVGHSEGGVIAPMIAIRDPEIAALVLMAGTARTGLEVLRYQVTYPILTADGLSDERKAELAEDAIRQLETTPGQNAWLRYFRAYDPLPAARQVEQPVLILQGALDRQVTADQADMLAVEDKDVTRPDHLLGPLHFFNLVPQAPPRTNIRQKTRVANRTLFFCCRGGRGGCK